MGEPGEIAGRTAPLGEPKPFAGADVAGVELVFFGPQDEGAEQGIEPRGIADARPINVGVLGGVAAEPRGDGPRETRADLGAGDAGAVEGAPRAGGQGGDAPRNAGEQGAGGGGVAGVAVGDGGECDVVCEPELGGGDGKAGGAAGHRGTRWVGGGMGRVGCLPRVTWGKVAIWYGSGRSPRGMGVWCRYWWGVMGCSSIGRAPHC